MRPIDLRLDQVGKQYRIGTRRAAESFWALQSLDLEVPRASSVGIIGANGAGKSTLLKLLAGITAPTTGRITISGALSALIEVGSGFHPELSGRENVFLSGAILGMRRRDIITRLDAIVAFAGVERFIDTPVKWYSSGMYVRLGFAIAAHLQPDILLIDEVLAVGDAEFQTRCLQRIRELQQQGVTIVFISHDLSAVEQLCDSAVLLDHGRKVEEGTPSAVVAAYHRQIMTTQRPVADDDHPAYAKGLLTLTNLTFHTPDAPGTPRVRTGAPLIVRVRFAATARVTDVSFEAHLHTEDGRTRVATLATPGGDSVSAPGGLAEFHIPGLPLLPGAYHVGACARDSRTGQILDWWDGGSTLRVEDGTTIAPGLLYVPHTARLRALDEDVERLPARSV